MKKQELHSTTTSLTVVGLSVLLVAMPLYAAGYHSDPLIYDAGDGSIDTTVNETGEGTEQVDAVGASEDLDPSVLFSTYTDEDIEYLEIEHGDVDEFVTVVIVFTDGSSFDFDTPMEATESDMLDDIADVLQGPAFGVSGNFDGDDIEENAVFLEDTGDPDADSEAEDVVRFPILLRGGEQDPGEDPEKVELRDAGRIALMLELIAVLKQLIALLEALEETRSVQ